MLRLRTVRLTYETYLSLLCYLDLYKDKPKWEKSNSRLGSLMVARVALTDSEARIQCYNLNIIPFDTHKLCWQSHCVL